MFGKSAMPWFLYHDTVALLNCDCALGLPLTGRVYNCEWTRASSWRRYFCLLNMLPKTTLARRGLESVSILFWVTGYLLAQPEFSIAMAGGSVLLGVGAYLGLAPSKQRRQQELTSEEGLDRIFRRTYVNCVHVLNVVGCAVQSTHIIELSVGLADITVTLPRKTILFRHSGTAPGHVSRRYVLCSAQWFEGTDAHVEIYFVKLFVDSAQAIETVGVPALRSQLASRSEVSLSLWCRTRALALRSTNRDFTLRPLLSACALLFYCFFMVIVSDGSAA